MESTSLKKRFLLFLFGCIGFRTYLVYLAKTTKNELILKLLASFTLVVSISFFYLFLSNSRKTGFEVFGDKIWWNNLRPIHGLLYLLFSYNILILNNQANAWQFLAVDVILGLVAFLSFHYSSGNFSILFS